MDRIRQLMGNFWHHPVSSLVLDAYASADRGYHNLQHLQEVLELVPAGETSLALALLYHDVVYDSRRQDNEQASADWARRDLEPIYEDWAEVQQLILDTAHQVAPHSLRGEWIVDLDLAILASSWERFSLYQAGVRREYAWVEEEAFRVGRSRVLRGFLARPQIYFRHPQWEAAARANLQRALGELAEPTP
jgi:predicted metal-dependent HD superfamily phosphohydrolase